MFSVTKFSTVRDPNLPGSQPGSSYPSHPPQTWSHPLGYCSGALASSPTPRFRDHAIPVPHKSPLVPHLKILPAFLPPPWRVHAALLKVSPN